MICTTKDCLDNIGDNNKDFKYGCVAWGDDAPKQCKDYRTDSSVNVDQPVKPEIAETNDDYCKCPDDEFIDFVRYCGNCSKRIKFDE